ncbi:MAG: hypothetical protein RR212_01010 [Bacteroidales bacterium]
MKKEEVLKLIKEYQDYSKTNDYPRFKEEINAEELELHEAIATSLREELEQNPDFFKELTNIQMKEYIQKKHMDNKSK